MSMTPRLTAAVSMGARVDFRLRRTGAGAALQGTAQSKASVN